MGIQLIWAFLCGGLLCAVGQVLIDYTKLTPARILTAYVTGGVLLSAFGWYQKLVDWAGAGASVPLTGFGHLLAKGVRKAVDEDGFLGIFTGGLTAAAGGITAALVFGLLAALIFRPKDKYRQLELVSDAESCIGLYKKHNQSIYFSLFLSFYTNFKIRVDKSLIL